MANGFLTGLAGGAGITIVIQAVDKFSKIFANVNKGMLAAGGAVTALGVAGIAASKNLIDVAASFESAFTGVRKTVELSEAQFAKLRQEFKDLSKEIPVSFQELSSIGEIAGQLGVEGVDNLTKFTKTIAGIAVTTNLTSEEAATAFARISNVMGEPILNVDRMASAIVGLGNNFATTEQEIVNMSMRIMGAGKTVGLSTQEVFGMSAALSALGIRSEMGGSAISRAMITIAKSVATGSDELTTYAEVSGMSIEEFSKAWKEKPVEAMSKVILGLKNITEAGGNTFGILEDLDLKSIRITDTMLRLSGSQDGISNAVDEANKFWEENTAAVDEANKRYETTESQVKILQNKFASLKDQMGQVLIPTFVKLVDVLGDVIGWMEEHPKLTKFAVASMAIGSALAVIVGPLLILVAMLPALSAGFGMLSAAMAPLLPFVAIVLGIAAGIGLIVFAVQGLIKEFKKLKGETDDDFKVGKMTDSKGDVIDEPRRFSRNIERDFNTIALNDFVVTPNGKIIKPHSQDTIIGTKTPGDLGAITIIIEGNIYGTDPDEMAEAFANSLNKQIRL